MQGRLTKKTKVVPRDIANYVTKVSLAYWITNDGYFSENHVILCTDSYNYEDILFLVNMLNINFELKPTIVNRAQNSWRIKINNLDLLKDLVKEFIIPSMLYKLGK